MSLHPRVKFQLYGLNPRYTFHHPFTDSSSFQSANDVAVPPRLSPHGEAHVASKSCAGCNMIVLQTPSISKQTTLYIEITAQCGMIQAPEESINLNRGY